MLRFMPLVKLNKFMPLAKLDKKVADKLYFTIVEQLGPVQAIWVLNDPCRFEGLANFHSFYYDSKTGELEWNTTSSLLDEALISSMETLIESKTMSIPIKNWKRFSIRGLDFRDIHKPIAVIKFESDEEEVLLDFRFDDRGRIRPPFINVSYANTKEVG